MELPPAYEALLQETVKAFDDPKPGDRFHEMYTWWCYVVTVQDGCVLTAAAAAPCTFPEDAKFEWRTLDQWRADYSYGSIPGYTVLLASRDSKIQGWAEKAPTLQQWLLTHA